MRPFEGQGHRQQVRCPVHRETDRRHQLVGPQVCSTASCSSLEPRPFGLSLGNTIDG